MRGADVLRESGVSAERPSAAGSADHGRRNIAGAVAAVRSDVCQACQPGHRPSIAPEKLLRAQLLQMLYSIRSERLLMEEIDYSMLFR